MFDKLEDLIKLIFHPCLDLKILNLKHVPLNILLLFIMLAVVESSQEITGEAVL